MIQENLIIQGDILLKKELKCSIMVCFQFFFALWGYGKFFLLCAIFIEARDESIGFSL